MDISRGRVIVVSRVLHRVHHFDRLLAVAVEEVNDEAYINELPYRAFLTLLPIVSPVSCSFCEDFFSVISNV